MSWIDEFPGNFAWSNAALVTKGMAPYGAVALGERLERRAREAAGEGRELTAGMDNCKK